MISGSSCIVKTIKTITKEEVYEKKKELSKMKKKEKEQYTFE